MPFLFLRGLVIGFALAAPVGPVGVLCIRRAMADGRYAAFIAGLGAAVADTFYGAVAGLGLTVISSFLVAHQMPLRIVGGAFLIILGLRTLRTPPQYETRPFERRGLAKDFLSTFLITLTNPATILAFMGVFAAMGGLHQHDLAESGTLISGVFAGSTLWWFVLSAAAGAARSRFAPGWLARLNRGSAVLLLVFGAGIMASVAVRFGG